MPTGILDVGGLDPRSKSYPSAMCCLPCGPEVTVAVRNFGALLAVWLVISTGGLAVGFLICLYAVSGFPYSHVDFVWSRDMRNTQRNLRICVVGFPIIMKYLNLNFPQNQSHYGKYTKSWQLSWNNMGVSKNKGTPKWMVKIMENPIF